MKHKRFCLETLNAYYERDLISFCKHRFDFSKLKNPLTNDRWIIMYIGNNTTLKHIYRYDVILFVKDGNLLSVNLKDFKNYLSGIQSVKFKLWQQNQNHN